MYSVIVSLRRLVCGVVKICFFLALQYHRFCDLDHHVMIASIDDQNVVDLVSRSTMSERIATILEEDQDEIFNVSVSRNAKSYVT